MKLFSYNRHSFNLHQLIPNNEVASVQLHQLSDSISENRGKAIFCISRYQNTDQIILSNNINHTNIQILPETNINEPKINESIINEPVYIHLNILYSSKLRVNVLKPLITVRFIIIDINRL